MIPIRQSTAFEVPVGPVLDADGVAVTDCVVGDFKIKKTTGNFAALNGSATLTHVSAGVYDLVGTTSDSDTVGVATIAIDDTVNTCQMVYLQVLEEAVYDAQYAASAAGYQVPIWSSASATVNLSNTTVKTLTDAPSDSSGTTTLLSRLSSARAGYLDNLSAGAVATAAALTSAAADITTILGKFTGITLLAQWLGAMCGKQTPNSTALSEINATGAGSGTYSAVTDSKEAISERDALIYADTQEIITTLSEVDDFSAQMDAQGYTLVRAAKLDNADVATSTRQTSIWAAASSSVNLSNTTISTTQTVGLNDSSITAAKIAASALDNKGNWNVGKTGYALTQAFPTNFEDLAIENTTGKVTTDVTLSPEDITSIGEAASAGIWVVATSGLTTPGSIGKLLVDNVDAPVSEAGGGSFPLTGDPLTNFTVFFTNGDELTTNTIDNLTNPTNVQIQVGQS